MGNKKEIEIAKLQLTMGNKNEIEIAETIELLLFGDKSGEDFTKRKKKREEAIEIIKGVGLAVGVIAGVGLLGWGISKLVSLGSEERKMVKAPGRDRFIFRDEFERDPASYFRNLRK
ncbi:hypothetical protein NMG60_11007131 [Bertholletia excelsa]